MDIGAKAIKIILLDIEGTVCPISFVRETLFPYFLEVLGRDLNKLWDSPAFAPYRHSFPDQYQASPAAFEAHVKDLVTNDIKAPYLKALQGHLWEEGYRTGQLRAPLFDDVAPAMLAWRDLGLTIMIYSSGSVQAQKLFFGHTNAHPSDLTPLIAGWFDTVNAGPKTDSRSYSSIASELPTIPSDQWLFLSDNVAEVEAAKTSGMQSLPVMRPGNSPIPADHPLSSPVVKDFAELKVISAAQ